MARAAAAKKTAYPTPHHARIDELLARAGDLTSRVRAVESGCQAELDALTAKHKKTISPIKQELETLDNSIQDYTRTHQVDLFEGRDRIDLANGALLHQVERRVKLSLAVNPMLSFGLGPRGKRCWDCDHYGHNACDKRLGRKHTPHRWDWPACRFFKVRR